MLIDLPNIAFRLDTETWDWKWNLSTPESVICQILICLIYAFSVKLLQLSLPKDFKLPKWMESIRLFHNISLSLVSFWMCVVLISETYKDGRYQNWQTMACQMTPNRGMYGFANFVYLVSKIWEWVDTYFLVLSHKPVITLHWFHHMTTFTMAAILHNFPVGGYAWINCLVHTIMYMHYAFPVRWARPLITSTQLIQFIIVLSIHTYGYLNPTTCYDMQPVIKEFFFNQFVVVGFFLMFCQFFVEQYLSPKNKNKDQKNKDQKNKDQKNKDQKKKD